jgi:hypothetical protein
MKKVEDDDDAENKRSRIEDRFKEVNEDLERVSFE